VIFRTLGIRYQELYEIVSYEWPRFWPDFTLEETGYEEQYRPFGLAVENGEDPAVVDAADLTADPEGTIRAYCETLGVEFMPEALSWEPGGFHGLSYEYVTGGLRKIAPIEADGRVVIAHLGNGASMAAVRGGVDTTMGFTPAGGLVMGTRSGDLDPGVLVHLLRSQEMDAGALDALVNEDSGFLACRRRAPTCATSWDAPPTTRAPQRLSHSSVMRRRSSLPRSPRPSGGWIPWCSREGSASTPRRSGSASATDSRS
jgi:hypothetical protein